MRTPLAAVLLLAGTAAGAEPRAWITDPWTDARLAPSALTWTTPATSGSWVTIDASALGQTVTGFGASVTESAAQVVMTLPDADREALWKELFGADGLGLTVLRQPMGSPDFAASIFSCDDVPVGQTDFALERFSIDRDRQNVLPLLKRARAVQPRLTVIASPWSPPAWMKTGGSMLGASGGVLRDDCYDVYARYFARFVREYEKEGVPVFAVTPQNEPAYGPPQYPGMVWSAAKEARFIRDHLGPLLAKEAPGTAIFGWDHNYDGFAFARALLADPATSKWLRGTAWHDYGGDARAMAETARDYPDKEVWMTEGGLGSWQGAFHSRFKAGLLQGIAAMAGGARSYILWNVALDARGGPIVFTNTANEGLVTVDGGRVVSRNAGYYALAHFSRFVQPGARRVGVTAADAQAVAFANPDGSLAVVLGNPYLSTQTVRVILNDRAVDIGVPGEGAATVVFSPSESSLKPKE
jgi:glucosylceramidase